MKDPFEAAVEEQESPPESPANEVATTEANEDFAASGETDEDTRSFPLTRPPSAAASSRRGGGPTAAARATKDDEEEEDEEQMEVHLDTPGAADPHKLEKMQAILSQFTQEQMNRYESFRRSGFQKSNIKKLLSSITGTQKISAPTNIVVSGIAKMFVGELIETARMVMTERNDSGPIRPCHIRESYRRLKLEGKIPRSSVPRLFR